MDEIVIAFDQGPKVTWFAEPELVGYENFHQGEVTEIDNLLSKLKGFLGQAPIALSPQAVARSFSQNEESWSALETRDQKSWFIKNVFGVKKVEGLIGPNAVGIEVIYRDDNKAINKFQKIHIHSLFPLPEHQVTGKIEGQAGIEARGSLKGGVAFTTQLKPPGVLDTVVVDSAGSSTNIVEVDASAGLQASLGGKATINLKATYYTPLISAMGTGDTVAQWTFYRAKGPLEGHDIPTWTGLLLDRAREEIDYMARIFLVVRVGPFPIRRYSEWVSLSCDLVDRRPT